MSENSPTIAILPENNEDSSPVDLITVEKPLINLANYSDKSFVVFGDSTKTYKTQIKNLGGKFNGRLKEKPRFPGGPAWIFPMKLKSQVTKFVNSVNLNPETRTAPILSEGNGMNLPTVISPVRTNSYQIVKWRVYKPSVGMSVSIKADGKETTGTVSEIETHKDIIDTVYVTIGEGRKTMLVICNGRWQVLGYRVDHTVFLNPKLQDNTERTDDIANI